jgi:hypothetical protein
MELIVEFEKGKSEKKEINKYIYKHIPTHMHMQRGREEKFKNF